MKTDANNFTENVVEYLRVYDDNVTDEIKKAVDKTTRAAAKEIKGHITFRNRTGNYIRAFRTRTSFEDRRNKRNTWFVMSPHYRLTHLLEMGHDIKRNGSMIGRTRAFPHVQYGADLAKHMLPELCEEAVKKVNK